MLVGGILSDKRLREGDDLHLSCQLRTGQVKFSHLFFDICMPICICIFSCILNWSRYLIGGRYPMVGGVSWGVGSEHCHTGRLPFDKTGYASCFTFI